MSEGDAPLKPTFLKRSRPRGSAGAGLSASSAASTPLRSGNGRAPAEEEETESDAGVVRRINTARKSRGDALASSGKSDKRKTQGFRFDGGQDEEEDGDAFQIRSSAKASSSRLGPAPPVNLDQASLHDPQPSSSRSAYSTEALAALKASTPSTKVMDEMQAAVDEDGNPIMVFETSGEDRDAAESNGESAAGPSRYAFQTMPDPMSHGDSRLRFGAGHLDEGEGLVPSQSVIEAAKERRRKAAAGNEIGPDDFVSINETALTTSNKSLSQADRYDQDRGDPGPHPESNLQREEDEVGSGEEEYADFTGATDRIAVDTKSRRREEARRKKEQAEMVIDAKDSEDEEDGDDDFERAQMRKMEMPGEKRRREHREESPYRPAPLPPIIPLPGMSTTRDRLSMRLEDLEQSNKAHTAVMEDAQRSLAQLGQDEIANKAEVETWGGKEAWVRELATFVESLSGLLEEKFPTLEALEEDFIALLSERTTIVQRSRAKEMEDELSLFFGAPSLCLLPPQPGTSNRDPESSMLLDDDDEGMAERAEEWDPATDGAATSELRTRRRETGPVPANQAILRDSALTPPDQAAFERASAPLTTREESLMSNVEAVEFQRPNATTSSAGAPARLHPSSIHARFAAWRSRYTDDYNGAWGGLAMASVWEFWARKELALWDALRWSSGNTSVGPKDLEAAESLAAVQHYVEDGLESGSDATTGGDDEAVNTLVNTVFVPKLMIIAEKGAYDPWSSAQTQRAVLLARQVTDFLDRKGVRFQSLVSAFLKVFEAHIMRLDQALSNAPAIAPPGFHPLSIPARLSFTTRLLSPPQAGAQPPAAGLLFNLLKWNPLVVGEQNRRSYEELLDLLVSKIGWELLRSAAEQGGARLAGMILGALPPNAPLQADVLSRLRNLAGASASST